MFCNTWKDVWSWVIVFALFLSGFAVGNAFKQYQIKQACEQYHGIMADGFVLQCNVITMEK